MLKRWEVMTDIEYAMFSEIKKKSGAVYKHDALKITITTLLLFILYMLALSSYLVAGNLAIK